MMKDKIIEILIGKEVFEIDIPCHHERWDEIQELADAICSLSLPTLSEGEIDDLLYPICDDLEKNYIGAWAGVEQIKTIFKELTESEDDIW